MCIVRPALVGVASSVTADAAAARHSPSLWWDKIDHHRKSRGLHMHLGKPRISFWNTSFKIWSARRKIVVPVCNDFHAYVSWPYELCYRSCSAARNELTRQAMYLDDKVETE